MQSFVAASAHVTAPITTWNIDTLTLAAFYFHPDLDVARAEAAVAHAAIATAGERPNPTASLPVEHKSEAHPWITVLDLDVPIETANKRGLRMQQATNAARAADLAVAQQAWQIRAGIREQLTVLQLAQASIGFLQKQRAAQQDLIEALQKRVEVGEGSRVELSQARINERQTALLLHDRAAAAAAARARLAAAVGVPESGLGDATFESPSVATNVPADLRERALVARPDILIMLADYAAAESALKLELARQYPDLHIAPGLGWDQGARRWDLGLSSLVPLLSRNRGPIAEAEARRSATEARFVALQAHVIAAIDEATARYREAAAKQADAASIVRIQRDQLASTRRLFNAGQTDRVALRAAEIEEQSAELAYAEAVGQTQEAIGALEDAAEQPLHGQMLAPPLVSPRVSK